MSEIKVSKEKLYEAIYGKFLSAGVSDIQAEIVTDVLLYADLRGVSSHGALRVSHYINRIEAGGLNLNSKFEIKTIKPSIALMDADGGFGHVASKYAMEWAIKTSQEQGIAVIGIKNNTHCGALGYYSSMAVADKKMSLVFANSDACAAPFGGIKSFFGTNPISYGVPARVDNIIADMATSEVAFGKILNCRANGITSIPSTWGIDENGNPTTDPQKVKYVLPFGGYKGFAIMTLVEILTGVLIGEVYGNNVAPMYSNLDKKRDTSSFIFVIDPGMFNGLDSFLDKMQEFIDDIHSQPTLDKSKKITLPGDGSKQRFLENSKNGINLADSIYSYIFE